MDEEEETALLANTGCPPAINRKLISFAQKYRDSMSTDTITRNRKLGTRTLMRIARRVAKFPWDEDLHTMVSRALLAEFLPSAERLNLDTLLEECGITRKMDLVCLSRYWT